MEYTIWINRDQYERNGVLVKTIVDNDGIFWLNEQYKEEGIDCSNLPEITIKYHLDHRNHRHWLVDQPKKQSNRIFTDVKFAVRVIMDCRTTSSLKFKTILGFKQ